MGGMGVREAMIAADLPLSDLSTVAGGCLRLPGQAVLPTLGEAPAAAMLEFWSTQLTPGLVGGAAASLIVPEGKVLCITSITAQGCPAQVCPILRLWPRSAAAWVLQP